ncbi:uncharacterized protein LOC130958053 [Arachis stenosperma]|uniref:uncharacterized protein LOC130958053 n=1 Tax=Arachis stenosperma TaxID=217475 RepID=UPI0025AC3077|nr:uncharacterized protein LOC130958053 [Arachis stenosperma]
MDGKEKMKEKLENYSPTAIALLIGELTAMAGAAIKNALSREACPSTTALLDDIMEELRYGHNDTIGVLGPDLRLNANLVEKVARRVENEGLFDAVVATTVSNKPNYGKIQDEIARSLGLRFDGENSGTGVAKKGIRWLPKVFGSRNNKLNNDEIESRARRLRPRMLAEEKILVILRDVCSNGVDLEKVGIPYGIYHTGCKLLLTSASEDVLSNHMSAQRIFTL